MPGLVPASTFFLKDWMGGTSPAMTDKFQFRRNFGAMPLRLIFMGTPEFAVPTLLELVGHGHDIAAVYTRAAKPAGRGMKLQPTPVEQQARRLGIPVLTPATLKTRDALEEFESHNAD